MGQLVTIFLNHQGTWLLSFTPQENGPESLLFGVQGRVQPGHFWPRPQHHAGTTGPPEAVGVSGSASWDTLAETARNTSHRCVLGTRERIVSPRTSENGWWGVPAWPHLVEGGGCIYIQKP